MNGRKAKIIRRAIYGKGNSSQNPYKYKGVLRKGSKTPFLLCDGLRREYQILKRALTPTRSWLAFLRMAKIHKVRTQT